MDIEIANVWHFDLRLLNLKPALGELYKKDSVCTKIRLFKIQYRKIFFWGGGTAPSPGGEGDTPSPHPTPLSAFGASILSRRSNLAFPELFF